MPEPRDPLSDLLRDAVADVEPRPALDRIRTRTKERSMTTSRPWFLVAAGAVAATVATVTVVSLVGDDGPRRTAGPAGTVATSTPEPTPDEVTPTPSQDATKPSDKPSVGPSPDGTRSPDPEPVVTTQVVPVYYVTDTPAGPRLVREFHRRPVEGERTVEVAVEEALGAAPLDPDYYSPWAGLKVSVQSAAYAGGTLTVDLSGEAPPRTRPADLSPEQASMAVEQLIYSAQAALGQGNAVPVQLTFDGNPVDQLLGVPVAEGLAAGDPLDVQAPVWVTSPQDGDRVGRRFPVQGRGAFFEATVSWQLLRGQTVVKEGFAMAQECCTLSPFRFTVRGVAPGDYVLRVYAADMSGGEGFEHEDTKRITVR